MSFHRSFRQRTSGRFPARPAAFAALLFLFPASAALAQYERYDPGRAAVYDDYEREMDDAYEEDYDDYPPARYDREDDLAEREERRERTRRGPGLDAARDHWFYGPNGRFGRPQNRPGDARDENGAAPEASSRRENADADAALSQAGPPLPPRRPDMNSANVLAEGSDAPAEQTVPPLPVRRTPPDAAPAPAIAESGDGQASSQTESGSPPLETAMQRPNSESKSAQAAPIEPQERAAPDEPQDRPAPAPPPAPSIETRAGLAALPAPAAPPADILTKMIGQMLFIGFQGIEGDEAWPRKFAAQLAAGHAGGVIFMAHNIASPAQLRRLTGAFKSVKSEAAPFIAVDQEGGGVQRLSPAKGFQSHPSAQELGRSNDPHQAHEAYAKLAGELRLAGFNLNFGPVADLLRNTESRIIAGKGRSYGADPRHVASFAKAFAIAHRDAGVLTAMKHFPGHGSAAGDTHEGPVDVSQSWRDDELDPYRMLAASKFADMVMVGHIGHPGFSDAGAAPASLSRAAVQTLLRGKLGYEGVTITDDLEMKAVSQRFSLEESVILAIEAGNDMLLIGNKENPDPDLPERVIGYVRKAVASGRLAVERIKTSYDRIVYLKRKLTKMQQAQNVPATRRD